MNNLFGGINSERKQIIKSPKGGTALLSFRGRRRTGFIESYEPSAEYKAYMKSLRTQQHRLSEMHLWFSYPEVQLPASSAKAVRYLACCIMNRFLYFHKPLNQTSLHEQPIRVYKDEEAAY